MDKIININKASELLGINTKTLRRWDNEGKLKALRTLGGHRRYRMIDIESVLEKSIKIFREMFLYIVEFLQENNPKVEIYKDKKID